jgi:hypothetical protein
MKKKNKFINFLEAGKTTISSTFKGKQILGIDNFIISYFPHSRCSKKSLQELKQLDY